jgi:hypothetical protein
MQSNLPLIWLLVATLLFIFLARSFDPDNPKQGVWLLIFAASWPLLGVYTAAAGILTVVCMPTYRDGRNNHRDRGR